MCQPILSNIIVFYKSIVAAKIESFLYIQFISSITLFQRHVANWGYFLANFPLGQVDLVQLYAHIV